MLAMIISIASNSQLALNNVSPLDGAAGALDSANQRYNKVPALNTPCGLTIQAACIKIANTGTTVAGYGILEESINDTVWNPVLTWKHIKDSSVSYGRNIWQVDTFTFANQTTVQGKTWHVNVYDHCGHESPRYRIHWYGTTCKEWVWGKYWTYKLD